MVSIFPLLQAAATFSREYTGAWAMLGAGIGHSPLIWPDPVAGGMIFNALA